MVKESESLANRRRIIGRRKEICPKIVVFLTFRAGDSLLLLGHGFRKMWLFLAYGQDPETGLYSLWLSNSSPVINAAADVGPGHRHNLQPMKTGSSLVLHHEPRER